jgi:glycosyltransferase involved in cell wall biosynthesis
VPESRVFDCPYFIDNARFASSARALAPSRHSIRAAWGIPEQATCFLFAGKIQPKKRILDLLHALRLVAPDAGAHHLLVVGTGEQMEEARALAVRERIAATFAGFLNQTEMPKAYVAADCLVLPSDYGETWGLVVNEAMACGLPAVVSDRVGCGPDLVEDGVTGRIFPFGEVAALAGVIRSLADQPARLVEMGRRASDRITRYSVDAAVAGTLDAVRYVTRRSR